MCYQDDASNPGVPFACGLTLEKLSAHTVNEEGNEAFVKDNPLFLLRKVTVAFKQHFECFLLSLHSWPQQRGAGRPGAVTCHTEKSHISSCAHPFGAFHSTARYQHLFPLQASQLRRFAVYFDVGKPLWQPKKAWKDMLAYDWDQLFKTGIAADSTRPVQGSTSPRAPSGAADRMYVVKPIDGQLQYLRRGKNVRGGESEAIQEADCHLQTIAFHVSSKRTSLLKSEQTIVLSKPPYISLQLLRWPHLL